MNTSSPNGPRGLFHQAEVPPLGGMSVAATQPTRPSPRFFAAALLCLGLALMPLTGCNMLAAVQFIIHGEPTVDPEFTELEEKKVVVVCYAPTNIRISFDSVDTDLAKRVSQLLKLRIDDIEVVEADTVANWLDQHGNWSDLTEIGKEFEADYVLFLDIQEFSIFEENSPNMYRGRAYVDIRITDVQNDGDIVYEKYLESHYPLGRPLPLGEMRAGSFRREYLTRLADEIGRHFYPYVPGEDVKFY